MVRKISLITLVLTMMAFVNFGCGGGGGSSSGGSSGSTSNIVGTWNLVSSTGGPWPSQITFNSDGTGNALPSVTFGAFTWTQQGNQVTVKMGIAIVTIANLPSSANSVTLTFTSGGTGTATYNRA